METAAAATRVEVRQSTAESTSKEAMDGKVAVQGTGFLKSRPISPGGDPVRMVGAQRSSRGRPVEDQGVMITVIETISRRPLNG